MTQSPSAIKENLTKIQASHAQLINHCQSFFPHKELQKTLTVMGAAIAAMLQMSSTLSSETDLIAPLPNTKLEFLWQPTGGYQSWLPGRIVRRHLGKIQIASKRPSGKDVLVWLDLPVKMRLVSKEESLGVEK